ncbi:unnamed protein product [Gongylonema pulchrum]|uniref:Choline/carnitine acyltransferase domain-containing protein n=1 Tax=Gongylonema pulchrum TaxID=637853 RepID=A0A3P6PAX7_9BILA|nr:unnamed protein product [Gongylonema pulchrum]
MSVKSSFGIFEITDHLETYGLSRHIAVYHRGCIYKLRVFDEDDRIYSLDELTEIFEELLMRDENVGEVEGRIAALTTDTRDRWHENRRQFFLENAINKETLCAIESAIFFLVLDHSEYYDDDSEMLGSFFKNMLAGDGCNRWADKSLNYVVAANGRCGGTTEHSIGDGAEFDYVFENFAYMDNKIIDSTYAVRLKFDIDEKMSKEIMRCYADYQQQISDLDVASIVFADFGKGLLKEGSISPDAFVQMALQLASYRDQGKFCLTYESASARFFAASRTETLRPVTKESCAFVRSMLDANSSREERLSLLLRAVEVHGLHKTQCMVGQGFDRHLFVLYVLSKLTSIRSPFLEYYIGQEWQLSTSQVPNMSQQLDEDSEPGLSWFGAGFGAVCKSGYGICYRFAGNHSICVHITSYRSAENTDSRRFQQYMIQSFHEISALIKA